MGKYRRDDKQRNSPSEGEEEDNWSEVKRPKGYSDIEEKKSKWISSVGWERGRGEEDKSPLSWKSVFVGEGQYGFLRGRG